MSTHEETLEIAVEDERIAGTLVTPGTLLPGVLFVHGWGGSQQQYLARARAIAALGCICLTFDLRGHADTRDEYATVTREDNLADVLAAYDRLAARRHVDASSIAVVGSSYGGYLASILAMMRPVRWLALRAPALYRDTDWELPKLALSKSQDLPNYRRQLVRADDNRALQACHAFEGDMLIVQSEQDHLIPASVIRSYREAATRTRSITFRCLKGADHGLTSESAQRSYTTVLVAWLKEMITGARVGSMGDEVEVAPVPTAPESPRPVPETSTA
jgi:pimeloyl-ACP methyl ester carboxylesterase